MRIINTPLYAESWNVAYRIRPIGDIINNKNDEFIIIPNSVKFWAADPMVFEHNNKIYIFAELYDYTLCRGTIGYCKYDGIKFSKWRQVLVEDFHMSFPNVFSVGSEIFMIPETSAANQLLLYKAIDFPEKWQKIKVIKSGVKWVDTVLVKSANGYLGFTEDISNTLTDYKLFFDNDFDILKEETVSIDSKKMRNGGRVFCINDYYVKVCQDCEEKYGGALIFRFYDKSISKQIKCVRIIPEQLRFNKTIFLDGIHTYTALPNMEVVDIKTRRLNYINLYHRVKNKRKSYVSVRKNKVNNLGFG